MPTLKYLARDGFGHCIVELQQANTTATAIGETRSFLCFFLCIRGLAVSNLRRGVYEQQWWLLDRRLLDRIL